MVKRIHGVIKVDASYEKREARVEFDPAKTSNEKIIETIEKKTSPTVVAGGNTVP